MRDLFLAELVRFRAWAALAGLLHLLALAFLARMLDPLQQTVLVYGGVAAVHVLLGLLLGAYQWGGYRRPATWLQLLHRPLPPARIALSLGASVAALLACVVALPLLVMVLGQELLSQRVADLRHFGLPVAAWLLAMLGYLAGAFLVLAPRRMAVFGLVPLLLPLASHASGVGALAIQALSLALAAGMLWAVFKPDLSASPRGALAEVLVAAPVQLGVYTLLVSATLAVQLGWMLVGSHPLNGPPPAGGYVEASRAEGGELLRAGLAGSAHPNAALWREQALLSPVVTLAPSLRDLPTRGQLANPAPLQFDDPDARVRWTLSHDDALLHGLGLADGQPVATLGAGEAGQAFDALPLPVGGPWLASARGVYEYQSARQRLHLRIALPEGETLVSVPERAGEMHAALSDRALYLYDAQAFGDDYARVPPLHRLPLPAPAGDIGRVDLMALLDGQLVSVTTGRGSIDGPGDAAQTVLWLDGEGRVTPVAKRHLSADFPDVLRHWEWWMSPAWQAARRGLAWAFAEPVAMDVRSPPQRPYAIQALAAGMLLLSLPGGLWLCRRQGLRGRRRLAWLLACATLGLPALLALRLVHPDRERAAAVLASEQPASA
ncbi:hypothetical protein GCM10011521_22610 [Arenimonas soli]|uniref:ABC transporter permease n=1 Tax=Arenimonas soli TaxID=2269504 RepID=A0ABQ1HN36_9GAMM|nr:hypothetical protein [Arenimonas soli]GGA83705.1 hypothetical protein GCM10011521_22610 [Arenimonas soli]